MYFDSSHFQWIWGVGSSGGLSGCHLTTNMLFEKNHRFRGILPGKKLFGKLRLFLEKLGIVFPWQNPSGLDPLNSYLSLPILITPRII